MTSIDKFENFFTNLIKKPIASDDNLNILFGSKDLKDEPIHLQKDLFKADWKNHKYALIVGCKIVVLNLAKIVGTIVVAPFALITDIYRCAVMKSISVNTLLSNFYIIPIQIVKSTIQGALYPFLVVDKIVTAVSIGTGNLIWHSGECVAGKLNRRKSKDLTKTVKKSILSDSREIRHIVYQSIGITALSGVALCIPILPIQIVALTILSGSIYGTLNNLFTNRDCPEYYTMGHSFDQKHVRRHAIKSLNPNLKAVITGCYATTAVTRIAGYLLSATATLPFVAATVPLAIFVAMVAGSVILGLGIAHVLSRRAFRSDKNFKNDIETLATGLQCNLEKAKTLDTKRLRDILINIYEKRDEETKKNYQEVANRLRNKISFYDGVPFEYHAGWHANNTRNSTGYAVAGLGSLVAMIATVVMRVAVF